MSFKPDSGLYIYKLLDAKRSLVQSASFGWEKLFLFITWSQKLLHYQVSPKTGIQTL